MCDDDESNRVAPIVNVEIVKGLVNKWYDSDHDMPLVEMSEFSAGQCMAACSSSNLYDVDSECENGLVTGDVIQS